MSNPATSDASQYAQAIYELALESWQSNLQTVHATLERKPDLLKKLNETDNKFQERQVQLDKVLPAEIPTQVRNFVYTLLKNGDLNKLGDILTYLTRLATHGPTMKVATVTTAYELSAVDREQIQNKLAAKHGQDVEFDYVVDASIIGGVVVQIGDKIIDGSVASKLDSIREALVRAS